jgi:hypothetical protein
VRKSSFREEPQKRGTASFTAWAPTATLCQESKEEECSGAAMKEVDECSFT